MNSQQESDFDLLTNKLSSSLDPKIVQVYQELGNFFHVTLQGNSKGIQGSTIPE